MYKGMVFEVKADYIVVHCDDGRYLKLKKKGKVEVGTYIGFFEKDIIKPHKNVSYMVLSIAAMLILALLVQPYVLPSKVVYAYVSFDNVSSVEYAVDETGMVLEAKALNQEGEMLSEEGYLGKHINEVIDQCIKVSLEKGYKDDILISETLVEDQANYQVKEEDLVQVADQARNMYLVRTNKDILDQAMDEDVSAGKMYLANEIAEKTQESVKELVDKSVNELIDDIGDSLQELDNIKHINEDVNGMLNSVQDGLSVLGNRLPIVKDQMNEVIEELEGVKGEVDQAFDQIPDLDDILDEVKETISEQISNPDEESEDEDDDDSSEEIIVPTHDFDVNEFLSELNEELSNMDDVNYFDVDTFLKGIENSIEQEQVNAKEELKDYLEEMEEDFEEAIDDIKSELEDLEELDFKPQGYDKVYARLVDMIEVFQAELNKVRESMIKLEK